MADTDTKDAKSPLANKKSAAWWKTELERSGKSWKDYRDKARKVIERYRNERKEAESAKRFNILYSNTETLGPAIYSQAPVPDIRRRWQDKDPVGRLAALVLQRATQFCVESYDFDAVLDNCKKDYLLPGFAVARLKYKPYFKKGKQKDEKTGKEVETDQELIYQEAQGEYVSWDRFRMSRSRQYERVWWVAFGDDLTKDEVGSTFGEKIAEDLTYNRREDTDDEDKKEHEPTVRIWEVWCKRGRGRFFVAEGFDGWVREPEADPLRLEHFFPNAKPVWSISTTDTLEPRPEYLQYEDQARELDDLTDRIDILTGALRRRGVYDAEFAELSGMLSSVTDNNFVPIQNWASFMAKGGLEKVAFELPLDGLVAAIVALEERRERVKQIVYEVTGIADIVRGASNPNETKGAQEIKSRWAGLRIETRRKAFANLARDLIRLKAEVIAERFDQKTLSLISGVKLPTMAEKQQYMQQQQAAQMQAQQTGQQPPPPNPEEARHFAQPTWEEVQQVLKSDKLRGFKIDIETDSTIQPDADAEKAARNELLTSVGNFAKSFGAPLPPQLTGQLISFAMRAYKVGSQMEQELEALETQNPGPTPQQQQKEQELAQREQKVAQAEQGAKDEATRAQMAKKDEEAKIAALDYQQKIFEKDKEIFAMQQKFEQEVAQIRDEFAQQVQGVAGEAERVVREAYGSLPAPAAANEGGDKPDKKPRREAPIRDIHIHTGGDKGVELPKPRGPRRFRMKDAEDGSGGMDVEELLDQMEAAE